MLLCNYNMCVKMIIVSHQCGRGSKCVESSHGNCCSAQTCLCKSVCSRAGKKLGFLLELFIGFLKAF